MVVVVKRGLKEAIPSARLRAKIVDKQTMSTTTKTEIAFEVQGFSDKQRSQEKQPFWNVPGIQTIIFELPKSEMDSDNAVDERVSQIAEIAATPT